jgi:hypothetical protein
MRRAAVKARATAALALATTVRSHVTLLGLTPRPRPVPFAIFPELVTSSGSYFPGNRMTGRRRCC